MAYASLWDKSETNISILHIKKRIFSILDAYKELYPEVSEIFVCPSNDLAEDICKQFLDAGIVYHCPNRISISQKREEQFQNIIFQRGIAIDDISSVSGLGLYTMSSDSATSNDIKSMFGLQQNKLSTLWENTLAQANWRKCTSLNNIEFLKLQAPFSNGYWTNNPNTKGVISLLRTGMPGSKIFYLYRYVDNVMEISPLSDWQVRKGNYINLANACLSSNHTLPPIQYIRDGNLVIVHLGYLLPPREMSFLRYYSWPKKYPSHNFTRIFQREIFDAFRNILIDMEYEFKEVSLNA